MSIILSQLLFILLFLPNLLLALNTNIISITNTDTSTTNERVIQSRIYSDNTILLRLVNGTSTVGCSENQVNLRLIIQDGTITNLLIRDDRLLSENFCTPSTNQEVEGGIPLDGIRIYALQPKFILLTYFCKIEQGTNSAGLCGLLVNWDNEIKDQTVFEPTCTDSAIVSQSNNNNDADLGGFLFTCYSSDQRQIYWSRYTVDSKIGKLTIKDSGTIININQFSQNLRYLFSTGDGGYGIVIYRSDKLSISLFTLPSSPSSSSSSSSRFRGPFQLYKPTQTINTLNILKCGISYVQFGYNCLIYLNNNIFVNVDFLDSGSILSTSEFLIPNPVGVVGVPNIINVESLYYGGYIILIQNGNSAIGLIYSNNGVLFRDPGGNNWQMPLTFNGINLAYTGNLGVFTNNTFWSIANGVQGIKLITNDLLTNYSTNFNDDQSRRNLLTFGNSFVNSVNPPIGSFINTSPSLIPTTISITFVNLIELSNGNISIWQSSSSGDQDNLRQSFPGNQLQFVKVENDNKTVTVTVFDSTFNIFGAQYYVKIDNGFVKDLRTGQDLLGIRENRWNFNTSPSTQDMSTGSSSAIMRLTPEGTKYFRNLTDSKRDEFSREMGEELSRIIPIDQTRLFTTKHFQFDPSTDSDQILIRMDVKGNNGELKGVDNSISSSRVIKDLDIMIKNKDFTGISRNDCSSMLDSTFGGAEAPNLWKKYRLILIGVGVGLLILLILFLIASRSKKGRNYVVFIFAIIIADFGLDVAFIIVHGHDLKWLYPATVVILVFPILINSIVTFMIITRETKVTKQSLISGTPDDNSKFREWWYNNPKTALFFTLFSSIDIEGLNIISSGYSGYDRFNAPISDRSIKIVLIVNTIVKIIEDIPQLIIYILYLIFTVIPAIIPIIALSTCSVVIILKSIGILGHGIFYSPPRSYYNTQKHKTEELRKNGEYEPPTRPSPEQPGTPTKIKRISNGIFSSIMRHPKEYDLPKTKSGPGKEVATSITKVDDDSELGDEKKEERKSKEGVIETTDGTTIISDTSGQGQEEVIDPGTTGGEGTSGGYKSRLIEDFSIVDEPQQQQEQEEEEEEEAEPSSPTTSIKNIVRSISGSIRGSKRKGSQGSKKGKSKEEDGDESKDDG